MKAKFPTPPYAPKTYLIDGVIIVDKNKDFDDNPLFFVNSEYPKYKVLNEFNRFMFDYEFYVDKAGNRYMVVSDRTDTTYKILMELLVKANWRIARNVDAFVENVDKESYSRWLEEIS